MNGTLRLYQAIQRVAREAVDSARFDLIAEMEHVVSTTIEGITGLEPHVVRRYYLTVVTSDGTEQIECSPVDPWEWVDVEAHVTAP